MTSPPWSSPPGPQPHGGARPGSYPPPGSTPGWGQPNWGQSYRQPGYPPPPPGSTPYGQPPNNGPVGPSFGGPQSTVPYYGSSPQAPPPRRRNPLAAVLLGMVVLVVLALAGLALASSLGSTPQASYQNADYEVPPPDRNPPPLPQPSTYGEAEDWLTNNALYAQSVPVPVRCDSAPINVATADDPRLAAHFNGLMECLVRVWQPPLTSADWVIVRPTVTIYGKEISTKCGKSGVNAFYCSADQQIYFSNLLAESVPIVQRDKWAADVVMAHEFGHAIQGRTGLLISAHALAQNTESKPESNQMLRRLETQADCFSGQFMRSVSQSLGIQQSDVAGIQATWEAVGDDTLTGDDGVDGNHGLARSRVYWGSAGFNSSAISSCNTFSAPGRLVR
ncbi:MAG TPA: neutral zinc metallopeptidase [Microlunatus sp.]